MNWVLELLAKIVFNVICVKLREAESIEGPKLERIVSTINDYLVVMDLLIIKKVYAKPTD